eukprot:g6590.t1
MMQEVETAVDVRVATTEETPPVEVPISEAFRDIITICTRRAPEERLLTCAPAAEMSKEESLEKIEALFQELCSSLNPAELPNNTQGLEEGLEQVYRRLPGLLRMRPESLPDHASLIQLVGVGVASLRWKLKKLEPDDSGLAKYSRQSSLNAWWKGFKDGGPPGKDVMALTGGEEILPWSEAEEVAWSCLTWRLVSSMAPQLKRGRFWRLWLAAVQRVRMEHFEAALQLLQRHVEGTGARDPSKGLIEKVKKGIQAIQKEREEGPANTTPLGLRPHERDQRHLNRVRANFPGLLSDPSAPQERERRSPPRPADPLQQQRAASLWIAQQLKDLLGVKIPQDLLIKQELRWKKGEWVCVRRDGQLRNGQLGESAGGPHFDAGWKWMLESL